MRVWIGGGGGGGTVVSCQLSVRFWPFFSCGLTPSRPSKMLWAS